MATFLQKEKQRYSTLKSGLVSKAAQQDGDYKGKSYPFCIPSEYAAENLAPIVREEALAYFQAHKIGWHDGSATRPSNHLCSSQVACVNALWPLSNDPALLAHVFRPFLPDLAEVLPFGADGLLSSGQVPALAFEWIGTQPYLGERSWTRGANSTSADFAFRFRRYGGRVQLVLGEWKYTESYAAKLAARLETYKAAFARWREKQPDLPAYESFFAEPFYQLMRLTLLAQAMERARSDKDGGEMDTDIVSVVHVSPRANRDFATSLTSPALNALGENVIDIWRRLVPAERFTAIASESLLSVVELVASAPLRPWANYMLQRYGWWRTPAAEPSSRC